MTNIFKTINSIIFILCILYNLKILLYILRAIQYTDTLSNTCLTHLVLVPVDPKSCKADRKAKYGSGHFFLICVIYNP